MKLSDFGSNRYSQFGEDGVLDRILRTIGEGNRVCVEFGGSDGISCSNTKVLRDNGWRAVLVEADPGLIERCSQVTNGESNSTTVGRMITPTGVDSIDSILAEQNISEVDFMSIDVDGDELWIVGSMVIKPRILCVEFNKTVPPHLDICPNGPGNRFGVGILTLKKCAELRGYTFIGITDCNAWFVHTEYADQFEDLEKDLNVLMPPGNFMYLATDQDGRMVPVGASPAWGLRWPVSSTTWVTNQTNLLEVTSDLSSDWINARIFDELRDIKAKLSQN